MKSHKSIIRSLSMTALALFILSNQIQSVQAEETINEPTSSLTTESVSSQDSITETPPTNNMDGIEVESKEQSETTVSEEVTSLSSQETSNSNKETSQTEIPTSPETTSQAIHTESETDGPILPMPAGLVGTWSAFSPDGFGYTFTFNPDGSGSRIIHNDSKDTSYFRIDKVQLVGENTYRFVAGENIYKISEVGFGGTGVKYQPGFYLAGDSFSPIMWQTGNQTDFDYTQAHRYKSPLVYKRDAQEEKSQIPTRQAVAPTKAITNSSKTLPQTGEASLGLLPIIGGLLLSIPVLKKYRR